MRGGERIELPDQLPVAAAGQQRLGPRLQRRQPPFLQPARLRLRERRVVHVGQGRAAPQAQCLVQPAGRERAVPGRQRRLPVPGQVLEPRRVQFAGRHPDQVTRRPRHQPVRLAGRPQRLAQLGYPDLQAGRRPVRGLPGPQLSGQPVRRDDLVGVHEQHRQHRPGTRALHRQGLPARGDLERAQDAELHHAFPVSLR